MVNKSPRHVSPGCHLLPTPLSPGPSGTTCEAEADGCPGPWAPGRGYATICQVWGTPDILCSPGGHSTPSADQVLGVWPSSAHSNRSKKGRGGGCALMPHGPQPCPGWGLSEYQTPMGAGGPQAESRRPLLWSCPPALLLSLFSGFSFDPNSSPHLLCTPTAPGSPFCTSMTRSVPWSLPAQCLRLLGAAAGPCLHGAGPW